jgi:hypothetical protein
MDDTGWDCFAHVFILLKYSHAPNGGVMPLQGYW